MTRPLTARCVARQAMLARRARHRLLNAPTTASTTSAINNAFTGGCEPMLIRSLRRGALLLQLLPLTATGAVANASAPSPLCTPARGFFSPTSALHVTAPMPSATASATPPTSTTTDAAPPSPVRRRGMRKRSGGGSAPRGRAPAHPSPTPVSAVTTSITAPSHATAAEGDGVTVAPPPLSPRKPTQDVVEPPIGTPTPPAARRAQTPAAASAPPPPSSVTVKPNGHIKKTVQRNEESVAAAAAAAAGTPARSTVAAAAKKSGVPNSLLSALMEKKRKKQMLLREQQQQPQHGEELVSTTATTAAVEAPAAAATKEVAAAEVKATEKGAETSAAPEAVRVEEESAAKKDASTTVTVAPAAAAVTHNNRTSKRRAGGGARGRRGRAGSPSPTTTAKSHQEAEEDADVMEAAAEAAETDSAAVAATTIAIATATATADKAVEKTKGAVAATVATEENAGEATAATDAESQSAIDAAVEAALAEAIAQDLAATAEHTPEAETLSSVTSPTGAATTSSKKGKKKKKKKATRSAGSEEDATAATAATAAVATTARPNAEAEGTAIPAAAVVEEEASLDSAELMPSVPAAPEGDGEAVLEAEQCAEKQEDVASAAEEEADMEQIFADSWLPSSATIASRAQRRKREQQKEKEALTAAAAAAEVGETEAALVTGAAVSAVAAESEAQTSKAPDETEEEEAALPFSNAAEEEVDDDDATVVKAKRRSASRRRTSARRPSATKEAVESVAEDDAAVVEEAAQVVEVAELKAAAATAKTQEAAGAGASSSFLATATVSPKQLRIRRAKKLRKLLVQQLRCLAEEQKAKRKATAAVSASAAAAAAKTVEEERAKEKGAPPSRSSSRASKAKKVRKNKRASSTAAAAATATTAESIEAEATVKEAVCEEEGVETLQATSTAGETGDDTALENADEEVSSTATAAAKSMTTAATRKAALPDLSADVVQVEEDDAEGLAELEALEANLLRVEQLYIDMCAKGLEASPAAIDAADGGQDAEEEEEHTDMGLDEGDANAKPHTASTLRAKILNSGSGNKKSSSSSSSSSTGGGAGGKGAKGAGGNNNNNKSNPIYFPDYREQVLLIFQQLAEINYALGEKYKTASYSSATERLKKNDTIFKILPPHLQPVDESVLGKCGKKEEVLGFLEKRRYARDASQVIPGVGDKLRKKIVEVLETGDLKELHVLKQKPLIRAIQELTQVHGFGPRTAISFYKDYGISTVEELEQYAKAHDSGSPLPTTGASSSSSSSSSSGRRTKKRKEFHLTDAQRVGLRYYKDIQQRLPHAEGRLHEAYLKLKIRKYLGKNYDLTVCGSYRRKCPTSGDIDVLITPKIVSSSSSSVSAQNRSRTTTTTSSNTTSGGDGAEEDPLALSKNALATFVAALAKEGYMEASLAQGATKFMGVCRLRTLNSSPNARKKGFLFRRIDIRFVDAASYPAAVLYFTGSKNFNVIMRAEAIKQNFILNEYGLFRNSSRDSASTSQLHEMISKLAKAQFYSSKSALKNSGTAAAATATASDASAPSELRDISRKVESLRVKVKGERDIFDAIGMDYVAPVNRNL